MRRLKVLVSAFACSPHGESGLGTGEDILGWNIIQQIGRFHEVWVLASRLNESGIEKALQEIPQPRLHFEYFNLPRCFHRFLNRSRGGIQWYAYFWQLRAFFKARALHRKIRFDLFHHVTYANDWMASFIGALLPVPFVRGPGGGTHPVPQIFLKSDSFIRQVWEHIRILGRWVFRLDPVFILGQSRAKALLLCNQEAREAVEKRWRHKVYLFPVNGVSEEDLSLLKRVDFEKKRSQRTFRVLSAGRWIPLKGFSLAIKAFQEFHQRHPRSEFTIYGEGPDEVFLKELVQALHVGDCLHLRPWIPRKRVLEEMMSCDVFLFPSLYDGGGFVIVEAMAAGLPVVCLESGGPGFHIRPEWGIKIEPKNPDSVVSELAKAMEKLAEDADLRIRLGRAAQKRVEEFYVWDRLGEHLQRIYEEVLPF
jgi:glycosyltransferase involved in cell wall biosynthesis